MKFNANGIKNIAVLAGLLHVTCLQGATVHPLEPLDAKEVETALKVLRENGKLTETSMIPYLMLKEPPKKEVLAFKAGAKFTRQAEVVLYERAQKKTQEITVDLKMKRIVSTLDRPGAQPSVMLSEFEEAPKIVKADPRFGEAMKRRGIKNLDDVAVDVWAYGVPDSEHSRTTRLLRAITYFKGKGKNFYARPIDGLTFIVNMETRQVEKVVDTKVYPIPPVASELDAKSLGPSRAALKPLVISQPKGVNFKVSGNEIQWENWSFRYQMHPREGLVIYLVRYNDKGKWRPVLYRASLSEMMVPYGHTDEHWVYRAAFDEGEYGIGRYSGSLEVGTDVPTNAKLFNTLFVDDFGKPYVTKNSVAIYERDGGLLWKHFDMYAGGNYSRRGRDLVIGFITTISNYDYGLNWIFRQDGSLELEAQLTGIMLAKGSAVKTMDGHDHSGPPSDLSFGHLVAPYVVAPHHQHFFNYRIDMDVDGAEPNHVAELNTTAIPAGDGNPGLNAFLMSETPLLKELDAQRDLNYVSQRKWKIFNSLSKNSLGYAAGYVLIPGENASPFLHNDSPLRKRGGFVNHPIWVTQQRDEEMNAAGAYPVQRSDADGLTEWTKQNRSLEGKDLVLWYTFCVTHAPRPEEWPVMNTHRTGFKLMPAGFFVKNPALDVR